MYIKNFQNYEGVSSKDTKLKIFKIMKVSLQKTLLKRHFLDDTNYIRFRNIFKLIIFEGFFIFF